MRHRQSERMSDTYQAGKDIGNMPPYRECEECEEPTESKCQAVFTDCNSKDT